MPAVISLARDADLLLAEATFVRDVPLAAQAFASSASQAERQAAEAGVAHLALTHLWPGTSHDAARTAAHTAARSASRSPACPST